MSILLSCMSDRVTRTKLTYPHSASPLNGEAAELWDNSPEEFQKKVNGRHQDIEDE